jgi:hypothetical protein
MKKLIAGLVAGIVLGSTSVGIAATTSYWDGHGAGYKCEGTATGAICQHTRYGTKYGVLVQGKQMAVFVGKNSPIFSCMQGKGVYACTDFRS